MPIDASYEGDCLAAAGITFAVGREPSDKFQEKPAGVGPLTNFRPIDPYRERGQILEWTAESAPKR